MSMRRCTSMGMSRPPSEASPLLRHDGRGIVRREALQAISICPDSISNCFGIKEPRVESQVVDVIAGLHCRMSVLLHNPYRGHDELTWW